MRSGAWGWRSATSTAASSTACAPSAARCARAVTAAPTPALQGSPPVEETVAMFSGIVSVGPDGTASVDFDVPDFNGTVRVMAVAWSADKLGHGQSDVIVRDAVALTASGPRFLTLGDEARLDIAVHNVEGPQAAYKLELLQRRDGRAHGEPRSQGGRAALRTHPRQADQRRPRRLRRPRHRPGRHRRQASPDVRREAAGRRHQADDRCLAEGVAATSRSAPTSCAT